MQHVIRQFDVETAFLNVDVDETFSWSHPLKSLLHAEWCENHDAAYMGVKQAAFVWHKKTCFVFFTMGSEQYG